jgi:trk system potassium uptake protein TrkA
MYVVVLGAGKIGKSLAGWLIGRGHEVAIIDRDPTRCASVEDELGSIAVPGDGTEAGVLAKAGANRADILVAATDMDDVNLVSCQLAARRFGVRRTVAIVNVNEHEELFRILGIGIIVNTTDIIVHRIQQELGNLVVEQAEEAE